MTTINLDDVAKDIAGIINKLDNVADRKALISKISAASIGGTLETVDASAGQITSLAAATAEAARTKMTPLQAANAGPNNVALVRNLMARAAKLGYKMQENQKVDLDELNRALVGKNVDDRMALKTDMARLRLI